MTDIEIYKQQALANRRLHEELLESQLKQAGLSARQIKNVKHRVGQIVFWTESFQRWDDFDTWDSALNRVNQKKSIPDGQISFSDEHCKEIKYG